MKLGLREANHPFSKNTKVVRGGGEVVLTEGETNRCDYAASDRKEPGIRMCTLRIRREVLYNEPVARNTGAVPSRERFTLVVPEERKKTKG